MQKRKSFLMKLLVLLTVVFCTFAIAFGTVGCAAETTIKDAAVNANGELVLTYTDGTTKNLGSVKGDKGDKGDKAGTFEASCANAANHEKLMVVHEARKATCCEEQVLVNTCPECDGYEIIVAGKDPAAHGKWIWAADENGVYTKGNKPVENFTYTHVTELEELNEACRPKTCNDCGKTYDAHEMTTEWKDVIENAQKCVEEHLQVKYCTECKAIIGDITKKAAIGHDYEVVGEEGYSAGCASFKVILECKECVAGTKDHSIKVTATKMAEKAADAEHGTVATTCKVAGYDEYSYTYMNTDGTAPVETTGYVKKNEASAPSAEHTFVSGEFKFMSELNDQHHYGKANGDALSALLENEVIRPVAGAPVLCTTFVTVVGDCAVCAHPITFDITGAHNFKDKDGKEVEVPATCIADAYLVCQNAGCSHPEVTTLAKGHVWEYKANSFDAATTTVTLECKTCKATISSVAVSFVEEVLATTCQEDTIDVYKTTAKIANGLATTHDNFAEDFVVCNVVRTGDVKRHTITAQGLTISNLVNFKDTVAGQPVIQSWNENIAKLVREDADGKQVGEIRWIAGEAGDCANYGQAQFDCSVCNNPIVINLTGPHTEVGEMREVKATCTKYGYEYKACTVANCLTGGEVVYKYNDATEHNFIVDAVSEAAFMASPAVNGIVTFKCATCSAPADFVCKKVEKKVAGDGVCTPDKTPYVFEYSYTVTNYDEVEKKEVTSTVKVEKTLYDTTGPDSHRLVVGTKSIDGIDNNQKIEKSDENIRVWWSAFNATNTGDVRWIAGVPATCLVTSIAVFDCEDCKNPILVELYGACDVDMDPAKAKPTAPTCTTEGYTERPCKVCGTLIKDAETVPATGHNYDWTFSVNPEVVGEGVYATVNAGVLNGACKNIADGVACTATGVVDVPATIDPDTKKVVTAGYVIDKVAANCCDAGSATIKYYFNIDADAEIELVKTVVLTIKADGNHDFATDSKTVVYYVSEEGTLLGFNWCAEGEKFVKVAEVEIIKTECPDKHADTETNKTVLIEVYQYENGDKLMLDTICNKVYTYKAK